MAYIYLPADPRLIACAQNIENAQVQALKNQRDIDPVLDPSVERPPSTLFDSFSTAHDGTELVMIGSEAVSEEAARRIQQIAEATATPMQKILEIMQHMGNAMPMQPSSSQLTSPQSKEEVMDSLRKKCNSQAFRLSKLAQCEVQQIHSHFKPQKDMTQDELRSKLDFICKEAAKYA